MEKVRYTGRVVELTWNCPYCGRKNRGRDRECVGCGKPRGKETEHDIKDHVAVLEGEEAKKHIKGPDWLCDYCGSYNPAEMRRCESCDAPRGASKDYFAVRKEQEKKEQEEKESVYYQADSTDFIGDHGRKLLKEAEFWNRLMPIFAAVSGIGVIGLLIWFVIWAATPQQLTGTVTDLTWETSISLEEFTTIEDEGWYPPSDARIKYSQERYYDTIQEIDHYDTVTEPVTKYRTVQDPDYVYYTYEDQGNGYALEVEHRVPQSHQEPYIDYESKEVPVYRDVDIFETWYWYEYDRWLTIDTKKASGDKGEEEDPVLEPDGPDQRTTDYSRSYEARIVSDEETYDTAISKELYDILETGDEVQFEVYKLGGVNILAINSTPVETEE